MNTQILRLEVKLAMNKSERKFVVAQCRINHLPASGTESHVSLKPEQE